MTQMCAKGRLCFRLPHTCAPLIAKLLIRSIVAKPAQLSHPMISASSREHLVTDHWVSFAVYLHRLGGFLGGDADEQNFEMCWEVKVQRFRLRSLWVNVGWALHLIDLSVFVCKTQTPMAVISWVSVRIKHDDVCKALNSAWWIVKVR